MWACDDDMFRGPPDAMCNAGNLTRQLKLHPKSRCTFNVKKSVGNQVEKGERQETLVSCESAKAMRQICFQTGSEPKEKSTNGYYWDSYDMKKVRHLRKQCRTESC